MFINSLDSLEDFQLLHPEDARRLKWLRRIPAITEIIDAVQKHGVSKSMHMSLLANAIKVSNETYPELHTQIQTVAAKLDTVCPPVYITPDLELYSRLVGGDSNPMIVISAAFLNKLDADLTTVVLTQTLAHLRCGHAPYLLVADALTLFADRLGIAGELLSSVRYPLEDWRRTAMYSIDRVTGYVLADHPALTKLLLLLAGDFTMQTNAETVARQAQEFQQLADTGLTGWAWEKLQLLGRNNNQAILRLGQYIDWRKGGLSAERLNKTNDNQTITDISSQDTPPPLWGAFATDDCNNCGETSDPDHGLCPLCPLRMAHFSATSAKKAASVAKDGAERLVDAFGAFMSTLTSHK